MSTKNEGVSKEALSFCSDLSWDGTTKKEIFVCTVGNGDISHEEFKIKI